MNILVELVSFFYFADPCVLHHGRLGSVRIFMADEGYVQRQHMSTPSHY